MKYFIVPACEDGTECSETSAYKIRTSGDHPGESTNKLEHYRQIFEIYSNIKFRENSSTGSRVVPRGRTDTAKLIVCFRSFAKAPLKWPDVRSHRALSLEQAVCSLLLLYSTVSVYTRRANYQMSG